MISNKNWLKPKVKPYFHHISLYCRERLIECMESVDIEEMDFHVCFKMQKILSDEIDDSELLEFTIENFDELFSYIIHGYLNIRIHMDITGEMRFGVNKK
ncbi:MAG: hypothetical protein ACYSTS_19335 [Planctomycetota bacterium]|jgi:hypothetical protein